MRKCQGRKPGPSLLPFCAKIPRHDVTHRLVAGGGGGQLRSWRGRAAPRGIVALPRVPLLTCRCPALQTATMFTNIQTSPLLLLLLAALMVRAGHYLNADGTPHDPYHDLHLPHDPPLYPTLHSVPQTSFNCDGRDWGLHADTEAYCQAFHLCQGHLVRSFLCPNGTLFHQQFKVCDQFYNVRCGVPLEDL